MADIICKASLAHVKALLVREFGDGYSDSREILGLILLRQATSEYLRDLVKQKKRKNYSACKYDRSESYHGA